MLVELRRIREIQVAQREALAEGRIEDLEELASARSELQAALRPLDEAGLGAADLAEARAIAQLLVADQDELVRVATEVRDELKSEVAGLTRGRSAVTGYRPHATSRSVYVDSSG